MKRDKIILKAVNASVAFLISASHVASAMERDQMHAEVNRVLEKFQRNMDDYYQRTRNKGKPVQVVTVPKDEEIIVPQIKAPIRKEDVQPEVIKDDKKISMYEVVERGDVNTIKALLHQDKSSVNTKDSSGETLIHYAAHTGNTEIIQILKDFGADVNAEDNNHARPMHYAARAGHSDAMQLLKKLGAYVNVEDLGYQNLIHYAVRSKSVDALKTLGQLATSEELKSIVNNQDIYGDTPMHDAVFDMNSAVAIIDILADFGAKLNEKDNKGATPIHYAASSGNVDAIRGLARLAASPEEIKAMVNAPDNKGKTPLHYAVEAIINYTIEPKLAIQVLKELGADVTIKDKQHKTPIDYADAAAQKGNLSGRDALKFLKMKRRSAVNK